MRLVGWPFLSVGKDVAGGDIEACGVSFAELEMVVVLSSEKLGNFLAGSLASNKRVQVAANCERRRSVYL